MRPLYWGGLWGFLGLIVSILWLAGMPFPQGASPEALAFICLFLSTFAPYWGPRV